MPSRPEHSPPPPDTVEPPSPPPEPTDGPLAEYRARYAGLTRGELAKRDNALYQRLRRAGLLDHVPTKHRLIDDALAYYRAHYVGLTRGELGKRDPSLYQRLRRQRLLASVPRKGDQAVTAAVRSLPPSPAPTPSPGGYDPGPC